MLSLYAFLLHSLTSSRSFSLYGLVYLLIKIQGDRDNKDKAVQHEFTHRQVAQADRFPSLCHFPYPIARLIVGEIQAAEHRVASGKPVPTFERAECHCGFFRKYYLPCKHMFHNQIVLGDVDATDSDAQRTEDASNAGQRLGILTEEAWQEFTLLFEEGAGYDVWTQSSRVLVEDAPETGEDRAAKNRKRDVYEGLDRIRDFYFRTEEYSRNEPATASASGRRSTRIVEAAARRTIMTPEALVEALQTFVAGLKLD